MHSSRAGTRRASFRQRIVLIVVAAQLPAAIALVVAGGFWRLGLAVPIGLTAVFFRAYRGPFNVVPGGPPARALLYTFFAWWVACVSFAVLAPLAALIGWAGVALAALAVGVLGIWPRPRIRRVALRYPELPPDLDGLTIAQLSDLHIGPFVSESRIASWVARANRLGADVICVTGDLIASGMDGVPAVARALGGLRARRGVFACMGNHDYFGAGEPLVRALEKEGVTVLRNEARAFPDGLCVAGVDDTWTGRADMDRAVARRPEGAFTLLLAHDPRLFPSAAAHGVDLTLSGHTHAGQLALPFFEAKLNLARVMHEFSLGLYRIGKSILYVNPGLGTTGPPVRIGARAEITFFELVRAAS
jgi:predicted MPP superfamily phosphohydrolase